MPRSLPSLGCICHKPAVWFGCVHNKVSLCCVSLTTRSVPNWTPNPCRTPAPQIVSLERALEQAQDEAQGLRDELEDAVARAEEAEQQLEWVGAGGDAVSDSCSWSGLRDGGDAVPNGCRCSPGFAEWVERRGRGRLWGRGDAPPVGCRYFPGLGGLGY